MSKLFVLLGALGVAGALPGCNTIHGAGKDVEKTGQAIEGAADKVHDKMSGDRNQTPADSGTGSMGGDQPPR